MPEEAKLDLLLTLAARPGPTLLLGGSLSASTNEVLETLRAIGTLRAELGPEVIRTYVVSMSDSFSPSFLQPPSGSCPRSIIWAIAMGLESFPF